MFKNKKIIKTACLTTPFEAKANLNEPWNDYPRPQLVRDSFISLNGVWQLSVKSDNTTSFTGNITVPFPPESKISGICKHFDENDILVYHRTFEIDKLLPKRKILLHFGAVDQIAKVTLNGKFVGEHYGGYLPFCFDITQYVTLGENSITVEVCDRLDVDYPYGKQRKDRGGMWYTPVSGIWQTVWMESVPCEYIEKLKITPALDSVKIMVFGGIAEKILTLHTEKGDETYRFSGDCIELNISDPVLWSPNDPYLYRFTLKCGDDTVRSYFALRIVSVGKSKGKSVICLNGKPYFFHGVLDQGYFSDGIYLPATPKGYEFDILEMKRLGFNMLRKHIKIEPEIFYYYCDLHGMIVFQDLVNSGKYNFIIDTALPTAFLRHGVTHRASKKRREIFQNTSRETVEVLYNHPSVCYYTVFNEGWGQHSTKKNYLQMKKTDPTRICDTTSGWFKTLYSDVRSEHIYFKPVKLKAASNSKRPLVLSEFGGYSLKIEDHSYNLSETYGYRFYKQKDSFEQGLRSLYLNEICSAVKKGLCACVLTQLSDVEDETNGLVTYDRQVVKVDKALMNEIAYKLFACFDSAAEK